MAAMATWILIILVVSIISAVIYMTVKYIKYKNHINKVLNGVEDTSKRISSPGESVMAVLIFLLILWNAINLTQISFMQNTINGLNSKIDELKRDTSIYMDDISTKLDDISSPIYDAELIVGDFNRDSLTVNLLFKVKLREFTDSTTLSLTFGTHDIELKKDGDCYTGTLEVGLFEECSDIPVVSIINGEVTTLAEVHAFWCGPFWVDVLPNTAISRAPYEVKDKNGKLSFDSEIWLTKDSWNDGVNVTHVYFTKELNGVETSREEISPDELNDTKVIKLKESYDLKDGDVLSFYVITENDLGYSVKRLIWEYGNTNESIGHTVYDADGNVVFSD